MSLKLEEDVSDTSAKFLWKGNPPNVEVYTTELEPQHGSVKKLSDGSGFELVGLRPYTKYTLTVRNENSTYVQDFRTKLSPPNLSSESSNDYINLKWTTIHSGSEARFILEYKKNDDGWNTKRIVRSSFMIGELELGDTCVARVKVLYDGEQSDWSPDHYAKTIVPVPKDLLVYNFELGAVHASWKPVLEEMGTKYTVKYFEWGRLLDGSTYEMRVLRGTGVKIPDLKCGKSYRIGVKAVIGEFESEWSKEVSINTDKVPPPKNVTCEKITDSTLVLKWDPIENPNVTYEVNYWKKSFLSFISKGETVASKDNSVTICGLNSNTTYRLRVRSIFKGTEKSDWSENMEFETERAPGLKR